MQTLYVVIAEMSNGVYHGDIVDNTLGTMTSETSANQPLHVREVLDFMARHTSHRHVRVLCEVATLNSANVYASLSGRRPLPLDAVRRLADALCLDLHERGSEAVRLSIGPGRVLNFDVAYDQLAELVRVLGYLCQEGSPNVRRSCVTIFPDWLSKMSGAAGVENAGVHGIVVVCVEQSHVRENSYAVAHVSWPTLEPAFEASKSPELLINQFAPLQLAEPRRIDADPRIWIRLRSGFQSARDLDDLLGVRRPDAQPTGLEWAELLTQVAERGLDPRKVISNLKLLGNASRK